jgi:hypothetical protein
MRHVDSLVGRSGRKSSGCQVGRDEPGNAYRDTGGMAQRFAVLSQRQAEVLQWVADGFPDGVWKDFSYKARRMRWRIADSSRWTVVHIRGGRRSQIAAVTAWNTGRISLSRVPSRARLLPAWRRWLQPHPSPMPGPSVAPASLLDGLETAGGTLTVPDRPAAVRAGLPEGDQRGDQRGTDSRWSRSTALRA